MSYQRYGLQRQTPTSDNLQRRTMQFTPIVSHKAVAELYALARFGSNFTTLSCDEHVLYIDNNLHLF